jgi:8-amino-7-oxononanoate synthase
MSSPYDSHASSVLSDRKKRHLYRQLKNIEKRDESQISIDGVQLINLSSNDYLGLSFHPEVISAYSEALHFFGVGAASSRLVSGTTSLHTNLEENLASFKGHSSSLLFPSGYQANLSVISSLCTEGSVVFSDQRNHASIVDACRLSRAHIVVYRHRDIDHLQHLMAEISPNFERRFVVTDSVFSTDGAPSPISDIHCLCQKTSSFLIVDEAHATGVYGPSGRGFCAHNHISPDLQISTLSKAFGLSGAFVSCSSTIRDLLINTARPFIYTTALAPPVTLAATTALSIITSLEGLGLRHHLWNNISFLHQGMVGLGFCVPHRSPILSIVCHDANLAHQSATFLLEHGVLVAAFRPPTVPPGHSLLRLAVSARLSRVQLEDVLLALSELKKAFF